ncbi:FAD dependent oxidoreductase [Lasiosphaeria ovina]|uniref:FAD dependent oxidoreductase n=1 Tax=Lasiosphaeria ovina TaxID=92902 RepID=A0AAE0N5K9_9PEZI|nr:FAD dependent oxidoreductase [Lasiosphaeria ovina]
MSNPSYIIVGSGIFGVSTALAIAQRHPASRVMLIDRGSRPLQCASWDWTKVVRADYPDPLYARLALEAKEVWRNDPLYKPYYHETGLIWVDDDTFTKAVTSNYSALGAQEDWELMPVAKARELSNGLFANADFGTYDSVYVNWSSGYADAGKALERVIETAIEKGVTFVQANVESITFDEAGTCTGVSVNSREILKADRIILATGAETGALLLRSAPHDSRLHAGDRLAAVGLITGRVRLGAEDSNLHKSAPAFLQARGAFPGGVMPSNSDGDLKIGCDITLANQVELLPGTFLSTPPEQPESVHKEMADRLKTYLTSLSRRILGDRAEALDIQDCRICWDAMTPGQDFIISAHPHAQGLWIATGGSLHGWKFFPTLGNYVVDMLEGKLEPELSARWDWNKDDVSFSSKRWFPSSQMSAL